MSEPIPFLDLPQQHRSLKEALLKGIGQRIDTAGFIGGEPVDNFESAFATFCQTDGCVGVGNGTDALMLALRVLGVKPGDVVLVPSFTFVATAEAVTMLGATPRLVDIDPATYTMSPESLEAIDATNVKVVIPVHLYGQPADMQPILSIAKKRGWKVIEDSAQAHGATYHGKSVGSWGDLGCFSFYPGKNLGAMGDGGAVVGSDATLLDRVRRLSNHGRLTKYEHGEPGVNSRLDSIQALALAAKLPHLRDWNAGRARVADWYDARFAEVAGLIRPACGAERTHVHHLYVAQVPERDRLVTTLQTEKVGCGVHYPVPLHLQPAYKQLGYGRGDFPVSEAVSEGCISLPMFPEMTEAQVDRVATLVTEHVRAGG